MSNQKLLQKKDKGGFTLIEVLLGGMVLVVAIVAIMGAYIGQLTLNEHARNLSLAINDANRVMEQIRQRNTPCAGTTPVADFPAWTAANPTCSGAAPTTSWDDWLLRCGGGKGISPTDEQILFGQTGADPITVTVAVCWRHRNRVIGECNNALVWADDGDGVPESPASLTTLVTCR